jgi:predicted NAD-dependent protein-ADP-ribosyltransferase YbiA (DUF1768 family)
MQRIELYRANEKPFGVFSNLHKRAIVFEGVEYPTSEHAFMLAGKPLVRCGHSVYARVIRRFGRQPCCQAVAQLQVGICQGFLTGVVGHVRTSIKLAAARQDAF